MNSWGSRETIMELGACFYSNGEIQPKEQLLQRGCSLVEAKASRQAPPHAIGSTAALARAILLDRSLAKSLSASSNMETSSDAETVSQSFPHSASISHAVAALYATAFSNFVTGWLDNLQKGASKRTMYDLAASIDMPASFVDLRHKIVHEGFTGLPELRRVTDMAMGWLWSAYWETIQARVGTEEEWATGGESEEEEAEEEEGEEREERAEHLKVLLSEWMERPSENQLRNRILLPSTGINAATMAASILQALGPAPTRSQYNEIVKLLLSDTRMLAPVENTISERQQIARWDQLLRALATAGSKLFTKALVGGLADRVTRPPPSRLSTNPKSGHKSKSSTTPASSNLDDVRLRVLAWMRHLLNNPLWVRITRTYGVLQLTARFCVERPGPYSTALGVILVESRLWNAEYPNLAGKGGISRREQDGNEAEVSLREMVKQAESHGRWLASVKSEAKLKDGFQETESGGDVAMPDAESDPSDRTAETADDAKYRSLNPPIWATCATPIGTAPTW